MFCARRQRSSRKRRREVSDDPTMPRCVSHPITVPLFAGVGQWVLRLDHAPAQSTSSGERPRTGPDSAPAYRIRRHQRQSPRLGGAAQCRRTVRAAPSRALDAWGRVARRAAAAVVAPEAVRGSTRGDTEPVGADLHRHGAQHQMGHRHHVHSDRRTLVVSLHRAGFVFGRGRGLVDESEAGPATRGPSRVDGRVAAAGPDARHSPFRSRLPGYVRRRPPILGGAPHYLPPECGGQLCRQCGRRKFLWGAPAGAGQPAAVSDEGRGKSGYL